MKPEEIVSKISEGTFTTEQEIAAQIVKDSTSRVDIEIPNYKLGDIPMREDLESPLLVLQGEVGAKISEDLPMLESSIIESFNWRSAALTGLESLLKSTQAQVVSLQMTASDSESAFLWASDTLQTYDHVERSQTTASLLNGQATLPVVGHQSLNGLIKSIKIDKVASKGVPGNHSTISKSGSAGTSANVDTEPVVELVADKDPHANISYLLDNDPLTWFEWESVYVPRNQKVKKDGAALVHDNSGVATDIYKATGDKGWGWMKYFQWPGETTWDTGANNEGIPIANFDAEVPARLQLAIELQNPTQISYLSITPVLQGGQYPVIRSLQVSSDGLSWGTIATDVYLSEKLNEALNSGRIGLPEGNYSGVGVWNLGDRYVKHIKMTLETTGSYTPELKLGHVFFYQVLEKHRSGGWLTKGKTWQEVKRYPSPEAIKTVTTNGGQLSLGELIGGGIAVGLSQGNLGMAGIGMQLWNSIFGGKVTTQELESGQATDIFDGKRSAIAIKDIELARRTYQETGQLVSTAFVFPGKVKAVSIITTENIPEDWGNEREWLTYYISGDGQVWHKVVPQQRSNGVDDVIEMETRTIYLKVDMARPTSREGESPILLSYAIKGLPV